jgi:uncharacterized membrane protein YcjF (UPF0283 family)
MYIFLAWLTEMQKEQIAREHSTILSVILVCVAVVLFAVRYFIFRDWHGRQWLRWGSLIIILLIVRFAGPPIAEAMFPLSVSIHAQEMKDAWLTK